MKRAILISILVFFAFLASSQERAFAEGGIAWDSAGKPVCTASNTQENIRMAADGSGGAIIVWEDYRSGEADIYAQKIDENGQPKWDPDGVAVSTATNSQLRPVIVSDGSGGAIIAWEDYRTGYWNIYAVRISSAGATYPVGSWMDNGNALNPGLYNQFFPEIVSDGSNGAIIVWQEFNGSQYSIYAHGIYGDGNDMWGGSVAVSSGTAFKEYPKIINDGTGYVIVTWEDYRNGDADIYAHRIDIPSGILDTSWDINGSTVTVAAGNQLEPQIVKDGLGGAIITWTDYRETTTEPDIYAQRISSAGTPVAGWTPDGVPVCKEIYGQYDPVMVENVVGGTIMGAIIMWVDMRYDPSGDIYAEGVALDDPPLSDQEDIFIAGGPGPQLYPRLVSDSQGGGIGTCIDNSSKIFAQKRGEYGQLVWSSYPGVLVCGGTDIEDSQIISDDYGGAIVAWVARGAGGNSDIFAQRVIDDSVTAYASISGRVIRSDEETAITGVEVEAFEDGELVSSD